MMQRATRWLGLALAVAGFGCSTSRTVPATQLMIVVDADAAVRLRAEKLTVTIRGMGGGDPTEETSVYGDDEPIGWPRHIAVVPKGDDPARSLDVRASAADGDGRFVEARAITGFVDGRIIELGLVLEQACIGMLECGEMQTCRAGSCVSAERAPQELPDYTPRDAGGAVDAGTDASDAAGGDGATDATVDAPGDAQTDAGLPPEPGLEAYLKASNTGERDHFGRSVAVDGDTVVVGAPQEDSAAAGVDGDEHKDDGSANQSGAAYVYVRSGGSWSKQAYLKSPDPDAGDRFGRSVAVDGDTAVVGAPFEGSGAGAAHVYVRSDGAWTHQKRLTAFNADDGDHFGWSVAIDGDTAVVGARQEGSDANRVDGGAFNDDAPNAGAAYVYVRSAGDWTRQAYLKAFNTDAGDGFGWSVAIDADTVVVGAPTEDSEATGVDDAETNNDAPNAGAAYVYERASGEWMQQAYLKAFNTDEGDRFGSSVAVDGDTVVVGAPNEASASTGVDGTETNNEAPLAGAAYVYERASGEWTRQGYLKASNTDANDAFGSGVAVDGDTVVVGAWGESSDAMGIDGDETNNDAPNAGALYVYVRMEGSWMPRAYVKASSPREGDRLGSSVAVDGDTTVAGAWGESSAATSIDGDEDDDRADGAGAAYVYRNLGR